MNISKFYSSIPWNMINQYKIKYSIFLLIIFLSSFIVAITDASISQWPLVGKGEVRYLKMFKVYDVGLYSPSKLDPETILNTNISKCLKLDYKIDLTVDKFRLATLKILKQQHTSEYLETISEPLEKLQQTYKAVKKGDTYSVCYNGRNQMLQLDHNGIRLIDIKSSELAKAYLGIWLSKNKPISGSLYRTFFSAKAIN